MSSAPQSFKKTDLARIIKTAQEAGLMHYRIEIVTGKTHYRIEVANGLPSYGQDTDIPPDSGVDCWHKATLELGGQASVNDETSIR